MRTNRMNPLSKQLSVRITEYEFTKLEKAARLREERVSNFVRNTLLKEVGRLGLLSAEERKALGVYEESSPKA